MMLVNRITRCAVGAVLVAPTVALAGCVGSSGDKAGGVEDPEPVVITLASFTGDIQPPLQVFADEVEKRSSGMMRIEFEPEWRGGDPNAERGTIEDVKAGKVDMAWVGARVFDTLDVTSFQALLAPLLVDSYDLEERVFESEIPTSMLVGVEELGVVGVGVLPGPIRRVLGVSHPLLEPSDFERQVIGGAENELSVGTFQALGATLEALPAGGALDDLDATEQHLAAMWGNRYDKGAKYVGANVNLWPRPLVIFAGKEIAESLTPKQQEVLRDAAAAAVPGALAAARKDDDEAALELCRRGVTFAVASEHQLAELRRALGSVYADLMADPDTEADIEAISKLKTDLAASADTPTCTSIEPQATASPIPNGTYQTTLTKADWRKMTEADWLESGVSEEEAAIPGAFNMIFDAGEWTLVAPNGEGEQGTYTVFRDQIEVEIDTEYQITARWSLDGKALTFTDIDCCGGTAKLETLIWGSNPWLKTD